MRKRINSKEVCGLSQEILINSCCYFYCGRPPEYFLEKMFCFFAKQIIIEFTNFSSNKNLNEGEGTEHLGQVLFDLSSAISIPAKFMS